MIVERKVYCGHGNNRGEEVDALWLAIQKWTEAFGSEIDYLSRSHDRKCRYFQDMINSAHDIRERVVRPRPRNRKIENIAEIEKVSA
jgi:hypothetical protein